MLRAIEDEQCGEAQAQRARRFSLGLRVTQQHRQ
jgi:hypothetical protein